MSSATPGRWGEEHAQVDQQHAQHQPEPPLGAFQTASAVTTSDTSYPSTNGATAHSQAHLQAAQAQQQQQQQQRYDEKAVARAAEHREPPPCIAACQRSVERFTARVEAHNQRAVDRRKGHKLFGSTSYEAQGAGAGEAERGETLAQRYLVIVLVAVVYIWVYLGA